MIRITKGKDGKNHLFGRFSNRFRDRDLHANPAHGGEIVSSSAHDGFIKWLEKNPHHALELWIWHVWGSALKNRASWCGFTGNFMYADWELTDEEAKSLGEWQEELAAEGRQLGMSFGFYVLDYDYRVASIEKYVAYEASILPIEHAANVWTGVTILKGGSMANKGLTEEQTRALKRIHGEEFVSALLSEDAELAAALDAAGVDSKEISGDSADEVPVADLTEETEAKNDSEPVASPPPAASETDIVAALERVHSVLSGDIKALADNLGALLGVVADQTESLKLLGERVAAIESRVEVDDTEAKLAAAPVGLLASWLPRSILDKDTQGEVKANAAVVDGRTTLAKQGPSAPKRNGFVSALFQEDPQ